MKKAKNTKSTKSTKSTKQPIDAARLHAKIRAAYEKPTAKNIEALYAPDALVRCAHPVNDLKGRKAIAEGILKPISQALAGVERIDHIYFADCKPRSVRIVCTTGQLCGKFVKPLFGIPPTGGAAWLRFGEFHEINASGLIKRSWSLLDFLFLMRQSGIRVLPESHGEEIVVPGPSTADGVIYESSTPAEAQKSIDAMESMMGGLMSYKGDVEKLKSMKQYRYWHPQMMWYGPCGIGTTRTLAGFEDFHQRPFLRAFPDRRGGNHYVRAGNGTYVATGGWPSMQATHTGSGWLGLPASGRKITLRVMDFWRRENKLLRENWVMIDHLDLLSQLGRDVMAELPLRSRRRG